MKTKILVVDDLKQNRYLLEVMLKNAGYGVISAKDGVEAIKKLDKTPVSLIISDILMPKIDGLDLLKKSKTTHQNCYKYVYYL